jgi:hypothetical protein
MNADAPKTSAPAPTTASPRVTALTFASLFFLLILKGMQEFRGAALSFP